MKFAKDLISATWPSFIVAIIVGALSYYVCTVFPS